MVNAPLFNLLSVIAEAQTFKDWVPLMYRSQILYETSHFRKLGEFCIKAPWPYWNRSVYIAVSAMPVKGENSIIVTMKSMEGDTWLGDKLVLKDTAKCTECDVHYCSAYIETIAPDK